MVSETPILPWEGVIAELEAKLADLRAKLAAAEAVVHEARHVDSTYQRLAGTIAAFDALQGKESK